MNKEGRTAGRLLCTIDEEQVGHLSWGAAYFVLFWADNRTDQQPTVLHHKDLQQLCTDDQPQQQPPRGVI